ncbi:type IV pilus modification PilV family protein [Luteibacter sp.]|uniref:type IV pilus modification PilV family protein n=1 Tax=Luteibacter sp. TaxID=1886636 RepID=UPI003F80A0D2
MTTLIESLTAAAVFAIGASATATWVAQSSFRSTQAGARVRALTLAADMEARLRANPAGVRAGDYHYANPAPPACRVGCAPGQVASADLAVFQAGLAGALGPGAHGGVACEDNACVIRIRWPGGALDWGVGP